MEDSAKMSSASGRLLHSKYEGYSHCLIFSSVCAFMGALSFGYTIGYSSPAIPQMEISGILNSRDLRSLFGSLLPLAALIGSVLGGYLIDRYGRKRTLIVLNIPFMLGWLFIMDGSGMVLVMIGRFLTGLASGMVTVSCPVYIAETSTRTLRGTLGSGTQLFITIGILLAYVLGMYTTYTTMAGIALVIAIVSALLMTLAPETPRWFLLQDRKVDALQSLAILRSVHTDVQEECRDLQDGIESNEQLSWNELMTNPQYCRPLKISVAIMVFQQMSGINAIMFYAEPIFKSAGFHDPALATVLIGVTQVIASTCACFLMDRAGRRVLLMIAASIMSVTLFAFAWYYFSLSFKLSDSSSLSWLAITSLVVYIIGFSLGWGPIPGLLMSEIFPSQARGRASSVAMSSNWLTAFFVSAAFLSLQDAITPAGTFAMFGLSCVLSIGYVWKFVPETKGKSLEDIEMHFLGKNIARQQKNDGMGYNV